MSTTNSRILALSNWTAVEGSYEFRHVTGIYRITDMVASYGKKSEYVVTFWTVGMNDRVRLNSNGEQVGTAGRAPRMDLTTALAAVQRFAEAAAV